MPSDRACEKDITVLMSEDEEEEEEEVEEEEDGTSGWMSSVSTSN